MNNSAIKSVDNLQRFLIPTHLSRTNYINMLITTLVKENCYEQNNKCFSCRLFSSLRGRPSVLSQIIDRISLQWSHGKPNSSSTIFLLKRCTGTIVWNIKYKLDIRLLSANYAFIRTETEERPDTVLTTKYGPLRCFTNKTFRRFRLQAAATNKGYTKKKFKKVKKSLKS
jgi:hypothetical protein